MTTTAEKQEAILESKGPDAKATEAKAPETAKRRALGRGLESLLPSRPSARTSADLSGLQAGRSEAGGPDAGTGGALEIPLEKIDRNPFQTRTQFDEGKLAELAASIAATGVVQPILVRPLPEGRYQLIAGERRLLASKIAEKATIPAILRLVSDEQAMEMTIVENLQRADLNAMEQARAYQRLLRDFKMTQDHMSLRTGKDRASISNFLRLLKLPTEVQTSIETGALSFGHAKALMALESPEVTLRAAERVISLAMSVRQTEIYVQNYMNPVRKVGEDKAKEKAVDPNVREAQDRLQRALGLKVRIEDRKGRGKVVIEYGGLEDFDAILSAIAGE